MVFISLIMDIHMPNTNHSNAFVPLFLKNLSQYSGEWNSLWLWGRRFMASSNYVFIPVI